MNYLLKEYFSPLKKNGNPNLMSYKNWEHTDFILKSGEVDCSTNVSEAINSGLKSKIPHPPKTISKLLLSLKSYHFNKLNDLREWGTTKNIRKRKMSTIAIHNEIRDLIIDFDSLTESGKLCNLISHCTKLSLARKGFHTKDYDSPDWNSDPNSDSNSDSDSSSE